METFIGVSAGSIGLELEALRLPWLASLSATIGSGQAGKLSLMKLLLSDGISRSTDSPIVGYPVILMGVDSAATARDRCGVIQDAGVRQVNGRPDAAALNARAD